MRIRPIDLANTCAIFASLRTGRIARFELESYVQKILSLDSDASPQEIVNECLDCALIRAFGRFCALSETGRKVAATHNEIGPTLSESAKLCLLQYVYLNPVVGSACCRSFILLFRVDAVRSTFVYDRTENESIDALRWMQILHAIEFLDVSIDAAIVRPVRLPLLNDFLRRIRSTTAPSDEEVADKLNIIGDVAEEIAINDEKTRLIANGHGELACLVNRISRIDRTAGYDIISCRGTGKTPEMSIYIEVKGTRRADICFVWSQNEREVALRERKRYWIYVYTEVDIERRQAKGPIRISNPIMMLQKLGYTFTPLDVYVSKTA